MKGAIPEYVNTQILYTERIELSPPPLQTPLNFVQKLGVFGHQLLESSIPMPVKFEIPFKIQ